MSLPAPHLDDRTFQGLVNDAKRMVQQRCPQWTDHNVSDPGVTLIETFAYMVDQLVWRLNRVPDRMYVQFLNLLGIRLEPAAAARTGVTFWLSAPQDRTVLVPAGTQAATPRTDTEPVVFTTLTDLPIVSCSLQRVATDLNGEQVDQTEALSFDNGFHCFGSPPRIPTPGDCLYVGLSAAVPSCAVTLRFECSIEGVGVDPRDPPITWEGWNGERWVLCEVGSDGTGGFNTAGDVVVHLPATHERHAALLRQNAGWLRCRVVPSEPGQPSYQRSPRITRLVAFTSGGTTAAVNAEIVAKEMLGEGEGVPGQRVPLRERPVVPGDVPLGHIVETSGESGWEPWTEVADFAGSRPDDRHFMLDATAGEVVFGPAVREGDGSLRRFGQSPWPGRKIRIREYRHGGGRRGNVERHSLSVLKSAVPFVDTVENRHAAIGGTDTEDLENAKIRGPLLLRTRQRAVTAEDYENLAREAARDVARVRCIAADQGENAVRVLLVPHVEDGDHGSLEFRQLMLSDDVYRSVAGYLDERRTVGARVVVQPPGYVGLTVVARVRARRHANARALESEALSAIFRYFHPIRGGRDGRGWPFGRAVEVSDVHLALRSLVDIESAEVRLFLRDPLDRTQQSAVDRIELAPHDLVFSWGHDVQIETV